ncbi:hypothetical protein HPB49_018645 [Dermacentor silvarum]|uniref:Uncharacterized protein n=1 Tax=Dermacentor silvarum TaxID=543639 RepID=A0ACB8DKJ6_DERSI|nr:hypothetical protein HPB49_018645 [Dermacentor silvarum]
MFHGGTNYGFGNGNRPPPQLTSYDHGSPLSEAGDPTDLYYMIRNATAKFLPLPPGPVPVPARKLNIGSVSLTRSSSLTEVMDWFRNRGYLKTVRAEHPLTFEELSQAYGYVVYRTRVSFRPKSPSILTVAGIKDRGYVMTRVTRSVLSWDEKVFSVSVVTAAGETLTILVENQGRPELRRRKPRPQAGSVGRSFTVDYENDRFLKDGEPFRYISGSMHYFRVPRPYWRDRMDKMRMAGLNALQTYVEWSGHEPEPGQFNFAGGYNLEDFLDTAADVGLLVILRPGPYICSERDNGGLPYWLRRIDAQVRCRSSGASYMAAVARWLDVLLPKVKPYLYKNGGPILTVQVENEYGNLGPCDKTYLQSLVAQFKRHLGEDAVLFFTDYPTDKAYECDLANGPLVTADIGATVNVTHMFDIVRRNMRKGPLVVTEYYPGWMDNWGKRHARVDQRAFLKTFETILMMNASVNVYMFHGGTNFGFANGADPIPEPTSYDFEAPLNESGDPTETYYAIRNITARYLPAPRGKLPVPAAKLNLGPVELGWCYSLSEVLDFLRAHNKLKTVTSQFPLSFEDIGQDRGYVIYTTVVEFQPHSPAILAAPGVKDRGYVWTAVTKAVLSKDQKIFSAPIVVQQGKNITILVENTGRDNGGLCETKVSRKNMIHPLAYAGLSMYQFN